MNKTSLCISLTLFATALQGASLSNGQAARAEFGQFNFTQGANGTQQFFLGGASGLAYANGVLYVADDNRLGATPQNNRVMMFNTAVMPGPREDLYTKTHASATCWLCGFGAFQVLGQVNFQSSVPGRSDVPTTSAGSMNAPIAVGTDGRVLAVADTDNNRVLLWNSIPASSTTPPNIVLGQANFTSFQSPQPINANSLRGPQGVWIQNGKVFVADTQNHRVLIWNSIPTQNNQPADVVLGQTGFNVAFAPSVSPGSNPLTTASRLLNPVAVTSDGTRLFVADLGYNRVLIWNSIPTSNAQPADVVVGQPDMTSSVPNFVTALCADAATNGAARCADTLNFPRFALSDGTRLFIADGGNDRVLIFNSIPTTNGANADSVLGQPDFATDIVTSQSATITSTAIDNTGAVDTTPAPTSLAYDGTNLYVADPYNRRVLLFTPADIPLAANSVVNWASEIIRQEGSVTIRGTVVANDTVTVTIAGTAYTYTVKSGDTVDSIAKGLVSLINASDPNATALFQGTGSGGLYLSSKGVNLPFDAISLAASASNTLNLTVTASGSYLTAGTAATGAPGMLVEINGSNLSDVTATIPTANAANGLPTGLGNVQVYMDGIPAPIASISPNQVVAQAGFNFNDRNSTSVYVRTVHSDGSITVTTAAPLYIAPANPGLFNAPAFSGQPRPWPATGAIHQPGNPTAVVSIDGTATAKDTATISVAGTNYTYTVQAGDTLNSIVNGLLALINADPNVTAAAGGAFSRVVLTARQPGAAGTGIAVAGSASANATVTVTAYTSTTCCNVVPNSPVTASNPAVPGELIQMDATGLGLIQTPDGNPVTVGAGQPYNGPVPNSAVNSVSATMNNETAQVISAGLAPGNIGRYSVQMIVPADLGSNGATPVYIAQNAFISNTVTLPVASQTQGIAINGLANSQILVNPLSLVFGTQSVAVGTIPSTKTVTVSNPSTSPLGITNVQVTGSNASDFSFSHNCPASLAAGSSCIISITYSPANSTGIHSASLLVSSSASSSPQNIGLTGAVFSAVEIVNKLSGKVLDVSGGSSANAAGIQQSSINGARNQRWSLVAAGNGTYAIMNLLSGKVLDVRSVSYDNGALIQQYDYLGGPNQKWSLVPVENGYFEIVNVLSGKALDVLNASTDSGAPIQQWDYAGFDQQKWRFEAPFQAYKIQSVGTGGVLDIPGGPQDNGAPLQQWQDLNGIDQQWFLVPIDSMYVQIVNAASGKVLDLAGGSYRATTPIQQWDYLGGATQHWALNPLGNGVYTIVNRGSGRVLDVTGNVSDNGVQIQQYDYIGGANQQWLLIPAATPGP
ncbi:MAG: RICIN domain-containing protein [Bryobacteraceae bacterium]